MKLYQQFSPYGVAMGSTLIALILSFWLEPFLSQAIGSFFYLAILFSAWRGGVRAGNVAIVLSLLTLSYFFLSPIHPLRNVVSESIGQLGIFLIIALVMNRLVSTVQDNKKNFEIQMLFNTSFDGIVILDKSGKVLDANPRFADMLGYSREEIVNLSVFDWDTHFTPQELQQLMRDFINFKSGVFETRHKRKDGSSFDVEISASVAECQGEILRFCVCRDITERKREELSLQQLNAELEKRVVERTTELTEVNTHLRLTLQENEQTYQLVQEQAQLLDLARDSIIAWDLNSLITFWNQGAELMYGWTKAEALGQNLHRLLNTQFPQPLAEIEAQLFEKGYWEGELVHFTKDEYPITVSSRRVVQKDDASKPTKILEINNNIIARKQAELILQQHSDEVEDLYNHAPCGYHSLNEEGLIIRINDTELNWLGYSRDEVLYKINFIDLLTPESQDIFKQNFSMFKKQGSIKNLVFQILGKEGSIRWVNLNATAIKDAKGNFIMSRSTLFDISERKQVEETLRQYERIVSHTTDGIALINPQYIYQLANPSYLSWCNKSEAEVVGNSVKNILGQDLFDNVVKPQLERCLAGEIIQDEQWFDYPNLVPQFLRVTYTPYRDTGETISGVIVSLHDLTQLKQAEELLQQSELTLRSFFNSAIIPMGIVELHEGDIFHVSDNWAAAQFFGSTTEAMKNQFATALGASPATLERWIGYYQ